MNKFQVEVRGMRNSFAIKKWIERKENLYLVVSVNNYTSLDPVSFGARISTNHPWIYRVDEREGEGEMQSPPFLFYPPCPVEILSTKRDISLRPFHNFCSSSTTTMFSYSNLFKRPIFFSSNEKRSLESLFAFIFLSFVSVK